MYRSRPIGVAGERPPVDGINPYAGSHVAGPLGFPGAEANGQSASDTPDVSAAAPAGSNITFFVVGGQYYRLCRLDANWHLHPGEIDVRPDEAKTIIERAMVEHPDNRALTRLLQDALSSLKGLHDQGVFVLLWLRPQPAAVAAPASAPVARARPAPAPASPSPREPAIVDAQAAALKEAAASGVPFCEECAKAAAAEAAAAH